MTEFVYVFSNLNLQTSIYNYFRFLRTRELARTGEAMTNFLDIFQPEIYNLQTETCKLKPAT